MSRHRPTTATDERAATGADGRRLLPLALYDTIECGLIPVAVLPPGPGGGDAEVKVTGTGYRAHPRGLVVQVSSRWLVCPRVQVRRPRRYVHAAGSRLYCATCVEYNRRLRAITPGAEGPQQDQEVTSAGT